MPHAVRRIPILDKVLQEAPEAASGPRWKAALKIFFSGGILFLIYRSINFSKLLDTLSHLDLYTVLLAITLYALGQLLSAWKWNSLLSSVGLSRSYHEALRAYFFGMFVNTVGLGTVGGDFARAVMAKAGSGKRAAALASVLADRIHGMTVLFAIGIIAVNFIRPSLFGAYFEYLSWPILAALLVGWWYGPRIIHLVFRSDSRWAQAIRRVESAFTRSPKTLLQITSISTLFHFSQIFIHYLLVKELGANLSLAFLFASIPFVNIASSLPISIGGLGVREAMYVFVFSSMDVPNEVAVALGALWFSVVTVVSLLGGLAFLLLPASDETEGA